MEITLNITEDSKVELVKDSCEAVQGENNVTILKINFPSTIKGYSIDNYIKQIEFGECKELGECKKFLDVFEGDTYKLCHICTQFKKIMIQFTLKNLVDEAEPIVWKTIPFALEFCESVNAENSKESQATLLSLAEILNEWENYIKSNTLRIVKRVADAPTANVEHLGDIIFYLGENTTSPYALTYGHYYKCNYVNNIYEWTDLTQDPSLADVANGIREINNNQTMQLWVGPTEALDNEEPQQNVIYIPEDERMTEVFDEVLTEMAEENNGALKVGDTVIPRLKLLWEGQAQSATIPAQTMGDILLIEYFGNGRKLTVEYEYLGWHSVVNAPVLSNMLQNSSVSIASFEYYPLKVNGRTISMETAYKLSISDGKCSITTIDTSDGDRNYISKIYKVVK